MTLRPAKLSYFDASQQSCVARGQNFTVHRFNHAAETVNTFASSDEMLFIFSGAGGTIRTQDSAAQRIPARSFVIAPQGAIELVLDGLDPVYVLTTGAADRDQAVNAGDYETPDLRVRPVDSDLVNSAQVQTGLRIYAIDEIPFPQGNPRLKFLRTATISVNWVEYDGPRDRRKLSPHAHDDFEQGSLAIAGNYIHHIRTPWGTNAEAWQEDAHIQAGADSLLIIPPELVHTTEGVGDGPHILIDVFAPARQDFIAKGWVHNADDYASGEPV